MSCMYRLLAEILRFNPTPPFHFFFTVPLRKGYFMIINFLILLLKLGLRINAANYFKDQKRPSIRLSTVMFLGTPHIKGYSTFLLLNFYLQINNFR